MTRTPGSRWAQAAASLAFVLAVAWAALAEFAPLTRVDAWLYDGWLRQTASSAPDDRVVVLDIDEKSLAELGRWPWNRATMAALVDRLFDDYGVAALGFDVVFAEPDTSSGLARLEQLGQTVLRDNTAFADRLAVLKTELDYDARFARSLADRAVSLGYYFIPQGLGEHRAGVLPAPALPADSLPLTDPLTASGYGANLALFQQANPTGGYFNMLADPDGTARRMHLVAPYASGHYLSLSATTLNTAYGNEPVRAGSTRTRFMGLAFTQPWIELSGVRVPLSPDGSVYVPYRAGQPFPYVSVADVLARRVPVEALEGRILLLGSTAPGLSDLRVTPFSNAFPGVEIHANLISGMLDETTRHTPAWANAARLALVLGAGMLVGFALWRFSPVVGLAVTMGGAVLLVALYAWLWQQGWVVALAAPLLAVFGLYGLNTAWGFFAEARAKRQITRLFGQYVPPELADEMARDPARYSLAGQSREMSVLFSDIRGFTDFSEKLPPAELAEVLNAYLSTMTRIVQEERGTIDKYIGDAIMAFWNAPTDIADHASRAVATALRMQQALPQLNETFAAKGWPVVKVGVGVNTGRMSVGNMGSEFRMSYTVMGDAVNLGSRLEGITKQYGVGVLVTQATVDADPVHAYLKIDEVRVKGKAVPVAIYEPVGVKAALSAEQRALVSGFSAAFAAYQAQRWDDAEAALQDLEARFPRPLFGLYRERIAHFRAHPPPAGWDGVFVYTTK